MPRNNLTEKEEMNAAAAVPAARTQLLFLRRTTTRIGLTVANNFEEQLFQCRGWILHGHELASMPCDDLANFVFRFFRKPFGSDLRHIFDRDQTINATELLQLALMQDRDTVTDVLNICQ